MKRILFQLLIILSIYPISAQELPIDEKVRLGTLDNGLTYYIRHNNLPQNTADFYIVQKVGSILEEDSQSGLAHFLEHMAFNGTKHFPGRKTMLNYLEKNGAKFGANINAYTAVDQTVYNLSSIPVVREGVIDSCLLILHDWSGFITLDDEEIDNERAIIKEEWRTRNNASQRIFESLLPKVLDGSKYVNRLPIGDMNIVENFKYQELKNYYHKWYRPDLQAIIIVGDINVDEIEKKIKTLFSDISKPVNPSKREYYPVLDNKEPIVAIATDPETTTTTVSVYFKYDAIDESYKHQEEYFRRSLLNIMVTRMLNSRFNELSQQPNAPFHVAMSSNEEYLIAKTKMAWALKALCKENKILDAIQALIRENQRMKMFGFTDAEIERTKSVLLNAYENVYLNRNQQQNKTYVDQYVAHFLSGEPIPGIEYEYSFVKKFISSVDINMIKDYINTINTDHNMVITVTGPEKENLIYPTTEVIEAVIEEAQKEQLTEYKEEQADLPLVTKEPVPGKIIEENQDEHLGTTTWVLSNGAKVIVKKTDFKDNQILLGSNAYGGTSLFSDEEIKMTRYISLIPSIGGLSEFNPVNLQKKVSGKTVRVIPEITQFTHGVYGESSKKDLETLLQLTYLYFTSPRKDSILFSTYKDRDKQQIINRSSIPMTIFSDTLTSVAYGTNPRMQKVLPADLDLFDYDRIIEMYKEVFGNVNGTVFTIVGSIDIDQLKPLVERYIASLPSTKTKAYYLERNINLNKGKIKSYFSENMEIPKATVLDIYSAKLKYDFKTKLTLDILKQILDIVYTKSVREEEGGTYSVSVSAQINRIPEGRTLIQISFETDSMKAPKLNSIVDTELRKIASDGPSSLDLNKVKEYMHKIYQEQLRQNAYWSNLLQEYYFYDENSLNYYKEILDSISVSDIKNLTKSILDQENKIEIIMYPKSIVQNQ